MYLNFEDNRPETPTVPRAISLREGVLLSLVAHLVLLLVILFVPGMMPAPAPREEDRRLVQRDDAIRFVEILPLIDRPDTPRRPAEQSDLDRRSATIERPPDALSPVPFSRGNTPERVVGAPEERAAGPEAPPSPPEPPAPAPDPSPGLLAEVPPPAPPAPVAGRLGESLRNLQQYLRSDNLANERGGATDQGADIQFDSKGVDFGPWLRRFKNQVERNWIVPPAAASLRGRVVIQFFVLRNGTIVGLRVAQPSAIDAFTTSALNALKLSNPTVPLPEEYPTDRVFFTVTFHYNDR